MPFEDNQLGTEAAALVHLVAGSTGAGKTTYSMTLASQERGVRFSIDDWMVRLYGADIPVPMDAVWPAILDLGFTDASQRSTAADRLRESGLEVALHWLDIPAEERWRRVSARNAMAQEAKAFVVTRQMFDFIETRYDPPSPQELMMLNGRHILLE
jgi:predicted kinase